jgi:hypothetical protein
MPDPAQSSRWRRWIPLSVRGLIVLVVAVEAALGWLVRSARLQRARLLVGAVQGKPSNSNLITGECWRPSSANSDFTQLGYL